MIRQNGWYRRSCSGFCPFHKGQQPLFIVSTQGNKKLCSSFLESLPGSLEGQAVPRLENTHQLNSGGLKNAKDEDKQIRC